MTPRQAAVVHDMTNHGWRFRVWIACLAAVLAWGVYAYTIQWRRGLIVTGLRDQVSWGLYISNFVFWVGVSKGGTMISAIFRLMGSEWRRPITRMAEAITVLALLSGIPMIVADLGRPDRMLNLVWYGRIQSPLIWDFLSVLTYLTACIIYFYLPLIPDVALLASRDQLPAWRRRLYRVLAIGWTGSVAQRALLERAITIMAIAVIPLAVSVHTVVSWIFAMTLRPGWNSSIYGPYFVVGAIYSGAAAVIVSMWVLRRTLRLERYVEPVHFQHLGVVLLVSTLMYLYFNINEYLTVGYKLESFERDLVESLFVGAYAPLFWTVQIGGVILPILILAGILTVGRGSRFVVPGVGLAALLAVAGAWLKRFLIVVPTLEAPLLPAQHVPADWMHYTPTWVEWSILVGGLAGFLLAYTAVVKLFPVVSFWETDEDTRPITQSAAARPTSGLRATDAGLAIGIVVAAVSLAGTRLDAADSDAQQATPTATHLTATYAVALSTSPVDPAAAPAVRGTRIRHHERMSELVSPVVITAHLTAVDGTPLAFQPVSFSARTLFGTVQYGSRATDETGSVTLTIADRRVGAYALSIRYGGDEVFAASATVVEIDGSNRPPPGLPAEGVLIEPTWRSWITLPFLLFFGAMWLTFAYAFGYLVLWRMRRTPVA